MLRKQAGFRDEIVLLDNDQTLLISLWNDVKSAEYYHKTSFQKLVKKLNPMMRTPPKVETYEVATTTMIVEV